MDFRRRRFVAAYGLPEYDAGVLTQSAALASYFEKVAAGAGNPKAASNWVMGELLRTIKERGVTMEEVPLTPEALSGLIKLVEAGAISSSIAKDVFAKMYESGRTADEIVAAEGLAQIGDVVNNHEEKLPKSGRYNAGQKLLFFILIVCMSGLLLSGILIWRAYFAGFFPIDLVRFGALLHATFAFVIICAIIVHIYAGIWVRGSIGAMVRGTVTYGWARKHHPRWFDEVARKSRK